MPHRRLCEGTERDAAEAAALAVVREFALSVFSERTCAVTRRWTLYPEREDRGGYWNVKKLLKTIWCGEMDLTVGAGHVGFFKGSSCTRTPPGCLGREATDALRVMVSNHAAFFRCVSKSLSSPFTCSGFLYNRALELHADRLDLLRCVVCRALYSALDDNYMMMKAVVMAALRSIATSRMRAHTKEGRPFDPSEHARVAPLFALIELVNLPHYRELSDFRENCGGGGARWTGQHGAGRGELCNSRGPDDDEKTRTCTVQALPGISSY